MNQYLSPEEIAGASFETKRRGGIDPDAVSRHLRAASDTVAALIAERNALAGELEQTRSALEAASAVAPTPELDEDALTAQLGQHAARVLAEARAAAEDRIAEAESEADEIRAAAEELHAARSMEADAAAQKIRDDADLILEQKETEAQAMAEEIVEQAKVDADEIRSTASMSREEADDEASRIIREAELTRRQILEDLARRRSSARRQIEQLRAGRERLLSSHETVRRALDEISEELTISMSEARAAAETAGHSVSETTIEELEAEIETARLTGLLDTGPVPVVDRPTPRPRSVSATPAPSDAPANPLSSDRVDKAVPEGSEDTSQIELEGDADVEAIASSTAEDAGSDDGGSDDGVAEENVSKAVDHEPDDESPSLPDDQIDQGVADDAQDDAARSDLAPVVSLDSARSEVETKGHPAAGREANSGRNFRTLDPPETRKASEPVVKSADVAVLHEARGDDEADSESDTEANGASGDGDDSSADDEAKTAEADTLAGADSVGDLFASLRSTAVEPEVERRNSPDAGTSASKSTKPKKAKKQKAKQQEAKQQKATSSVSEAPREDDSGSGADTAEIARRIKRVLADEQSKVMSTLKGAEEIPELEELLGSKDAHTERYQLATEPYLDGRSGEAQPFLEGFVDHVRRKVLNALEASDGDPSGAVESLRSVYREVKTDSVGRCVADIAEWLSKSAV